MSMKGCEMEQEVELRRIDSMKRPAINKGKTKIVSELKLGKLSAEKVMHVQNP